MQPENRHCKRQPLFLELLRAFPFYKQDVTTGCPRIGQRNALSNLKTILGLKKSN